MVLLLFYLFLALLISFLCSIMESVLLSTPTIYIKVNQNTTNNGIKKLIRLKQNLDKPLIAILSLNTIAHTIGAAGVGAQAVVVFGEAYFGLISAMLTILILVLTEIIPKTLGAQYWQKLGPVVGHMIHITTIVTFPLVVLSAYITKLFAKNKVEQTISREDISMLAEIGTKEGVFQENENKIIQNLIRLKTIKVCEIMTPRIVVAIADETMSIKAFLKNKKYLRFSRIPVFSENQNNIRGYVFRQNIFENKKNNLLLKDIKKDIIIVPDTKPVFALWEQLLIEKEHIALVVDEYGCMDGIVTMEDIIETLLGFEIVDEKDTIVDMQQYARERWQKRQIKYKYLEQQNKD
ncbi:MAG: CNNM domain-containing protein [Bacteroidales bacterium]|nr:CNNM domain-containing protein [Bacteroidales bacterium]MDD4209863.1 CNNM domain-containing protein [Bacteroidales bacterium]MDY0015744.1 CNNM domain-containing protein [Bacteroidales bacterium]